MKLFDLIQSISLERGDVEVVASIVAPVQCQTIFEHLPAGESQEGRAFWIAVAVLQQWNSWASHSFIFEKPQNVALRSSCWEVFHHRLEVFVLSPMLSHAGVVSSRIFSVESRSFLPGIAFHDVFGTETSELDFDLSFDVVQKALLTEWVKSDADSLIALPGSPPWSMNIGLGSLRGLSLNDEINFWEIQSSGTDIGSH